VGWHHKDVCIRIQWIVRNIANRSVIETLRIGSLKKKFEPKVPFQGSLYLYELYTCIWQETNIFLQLCLDFLDIRVDIFYYSTTGLKPETSGSLILKNMRRVVNRYSTNAVIQRRYSTNAL